MFFIKFVVLKFFAKSINMIKRQLFATGGATKRQQTPGWRGDELIQRIYMRVSSLVLTTKFSGGEGAGKALD